VGGNPVRRKDPFGLATRAEIDAAVQLLRDKFPEVVKAPNSVTGIPGLSGTLGQTLGGKTDLNRNIKYNADFYGADGTPIPVHRVDDFLQTMAHEMQHTTETLRDRIGLSTGQLLNRFSDNFPSIEDIIDGNADFMYRATISKFKQMISNAQCK
jgi:hypothetical protein